MPVSGETYFFRDHGQFDLLRCKLLPELIGRRREAKTLRLWSAGCATGEEPYSLAMLIDMLLPARGDWDILILGSDIDQTSLAKARQGRYGKWSFRMVPETLRQRYFCGDGDEWALDDCIRGMVTFRAINLIEDAFPVTELGSMDLILCRNVFIYFSPDAVAATAAKLATALNDGGYLMTGHTELIGHAVPGLQHRLFPESVVYQRRVPVPASPTPVPPAPELPPMPRAPEPPCMPEPPPPPTGPCREDLLAQARELADRGAYEKAERAGRDALAAAPLDAEPYFLLAQLAQIRGDFGQAHELLNKTLYLDPGSVAAYLELSALYERANDMPRMQAMRRAALDVLHALPADKVIDPYETTAGELAQWLTR